MEALPSGTVTFLFTDIEGSTKLAQEHPDKWESLRDRHHAILQSAMDHHKGYVFQIIGDAFCVAFHTASDAINAAAHAQRKLQTGDWGETPIKVRMGIHTGEAESQANGEYRGYLAMSRVQRLMSAGHGNQTLISLTTQELVRDKLPENITLNDLGERRLKDLIHPEHIYQVDVEGLAKEFPALKTLDVQLNNLPTQLTPFIGRDREIVAVLGLLRMPEVHLVTLTGPGGIGKTRLSLQIAADMLDEYRDGVWFVELASVTDPELVLPTIASTFKVKESAERTIEQALHDHLHKRQLLLVLDNFEQVVSAAPKITQLLNAAPKINIMVSSREVLRLRGEHSYPVPPLGLPDSKRHQTAAVLAQYEAIALFVQYAQAANPSFVLDEDNASIVADICSRLDGLPLALELAAARTRLFKPTVMLEKLKNKLDVLTSGARDLPRRQQTIRGTIDWSYDLLDDAEKVLFARLGIFVGGWTLESAETVCGIDGSVNILNGIESLLDKSLIRQTEGNNGETRFTMLDTIREYAFEKLSQRTDLNSILHKHVEHLIALLENVYSAAGSSEEVTWFARLDDEFDNLRSTMEWTLENNQSGLAFLAARPFYYWRQRANYREPLNWVERALAMQADLPLNMLAKALSSAGVLSENLGDLAGAKKYYEAALALFREMNDQAGISNVLNNLGGIAESEGNYESARQLYEESFGLEESVSFGTSMTLLNLGRIARKRGDWEESHAYFLRARGICEKLDMETGISYADYFLGVLALALGKLDEAQTYIETSKKASWLQQSPLFSGIIEGLMGYILLRKNQVEQARPLLNLGLQSVAGFLNQGTDPWADIQITEGKARLELIDNRLERAAHLFGVSWSARLSDEFPLTEFERPDYEARINTIRARLGDDVFNDLFEKGKAMPLKDAIAFALEETQ